METVKGKGFGFSWADEVEREEEQEKENQNQTQKEKQNQIETQKEQEIKKIEKKTDPFCPARASEVIFEGKAIDWRKLDQEFDFNSNSNFRASKKPVGINKKNPPQLQNSKSKNQPIEDLVPPLKHPPKNINLVFEQIRKARKDQSKPSTNPNFLPPQQTGMNHSAKVYRPVTNSNLNPVLVDCKEILNKVPSLLMGSDTKKELIPVSNTNNPNFMPRQQTGTNHSALMYRSVTNSNLKPALMDSPNGDKEILNSGPNIKKELVLVPNTNPNFMPHQQTGTNRSNMAYRPLTDSNPTVLVSQSKKQGTDKENKSSKPNSNLIWAKKEKTGSNYKRKLNEKEDFVQRRALVDLNSKSERPICKKTKTKSSNSYFGVLDLLEENWRQDTEYFQFGTFCGTKLF